MNDLTDSVGILTDKLGLLTCENCGSELDVTDFDIFEHVLCPECETELVIPGQFGNFLLIGEIGRGGMGAVYRAVDKSLEREVALKVMRAQYGQDTKFYKSFVQEAQAAAALNHRNIVQIYSFGQEKEQPYIVMELVDHGRLEEMIREQGTLDEEFALQVALEVSAGLSAAHEVGLVHGDIKPANILFDKRGNAKVVDFGLARFGGKKEGQEIWGTPYYIAPEKARGKEEDFRSDQYSLGATLWHALVGRPPFEGRTPTEVVVARLKKNADPVHEVVPEISPETSDVIARMMSTSRARRYPTYESLEADLNEVLRLLRARKVEREALGPASTATRNTSSKVIRLLLSALGVALLTVGVLYGLHRMKTNAAKPPPPSTVKVIGSQTPTSASQRGTSSPLMRSEIRLMRKSLQRYVELRSTFAANDRLGTLLQRAPDEFSARQWLGIFQTLMYRVDGDQATMAMLLKELSGYYEKRPQEQWGEEPPLPIIRYLQGKLSEELLIRETNLYSLGFQGQRNVIIAVQQLSKGKFAEAIKLLEPYTQQQDEAAWSAVLHPLSAALLEEAKQAEALREMPATAPERQTFEESCFPLLREGLSGS